MLKINVLLALMIIVSFLGAIALHESGHAMAATWLGDPTPRAEGRQTLRIGPHIDALGLLLCIFLAFSPNVPPVSTPAGLGWGKPVKPDPWKLRTGPNTGVLLVALAGPIFSLFIGLLTAFIAHFAAPFLATNFLTERVLQLLIVFASINVSLALFNILPLYPLDGYQILYTLLPGRRAVQFSRSAPYGPFIVLFLFFILPFLTAFALPLSGGAVAGSANFLQIILNMPTTIANWSLAILSLIFDNAGGHSIMYFYTL
ncbi:MAG: site-2 protease family protein [Ktedonobacteraceae bacterium]|nr:site-2 protease family protein [Ktedonobacteraceae bacterium]